MKSCPSLSTGQLTQMRLKFEDPADSYKFKIIAY